MLVALLRVSLLSAAPDASTRALVDHIRYSADVGKTGAASTPVE